jgi:hypothetical protein
MISIEANKLFMDYSNHGRRFFDDLQVMSANGGQNQEVVNELREVKQGWLTLLRAGVVVNIS